MAQVSYADVFGINLHAGEGEIHVGDVVRTSNNNKPHYQVLAVQSGKAWLRNLDNAMDAIVELTRCRRVELAAAE
jgi:hypothetical protein